MYRSPKTKQPSMWPIRCLRISRPETMSSSGWRTDSTNRTLHKTRNSSHCSTTSTFKHNRTPMRSWFSTTRSLGSFKTRHRRATPASAFSLTRTLPFHHCESIKPQSRWLPTLHRSTLIRSTRWTIRDQHHVESSKRSSIAGPRSWKVVW